MSGSAHGLKDLEKWESNPPDKLAPLPPSMYCSETMLEMELDRVFYRDWVCVGHVSELAEPGDFITFDIVDRPVLAVRDEAGELRAFSNVCRHRACALVKGCGQQRRFVCPYHSWTYDLSGKLTGAPHMNNVDVRGIALAEYRLEVWEGMVFVSVNPEPEPFSDGLATIKSRIAPYDMTNYTVVHRGSGEIACNWKVLVENFCESYHVFSVHKKTLEPGTPTKSIAIQEGGPGFNHHTMDRIDPEYLENPVLERLPVDRRQETHLVCLYPCTVLSLDADSAVWLTIQPTGSQTLRYTVWLAVPTGAEDELAAAKEFGAAALNEFMGEDKVTIEAVQRGLASGTPLSGVLHPWERTNVEFGRFMANRLLVSS